MEMTQDARTPLIIDRHTLREVTMTTLIDTVEAIYMNTMRRAKYVLLSQEDYFALCRELHVKQYLRFSATDPQVMLLFGFYVARLANIPLTEEYSQARLTLEYLEYNMQTVKKGEIVLLRDAS